MDPSTEEINEEYKTFVKESVDDGSYFKDAFDWYAISYILPIAERSFFMFLSILSALIVYVLISIFSSVLPLTEEVPIVIKAKDSARYKPIISSIKNKDEAETLDETVLRFLAINFVKDREEHNYKKANIKEYNKKLDRMKNNSSIEVYDDFKKFMSKSNPDSPIHFFGKNVERKIIVDSFTFEKVKKTGVMDRLRGFLVLEATPSKAYVNYTLQTILPDKTVNEKRKARMGFKFSGVEFDEKNNKYLPLKFTVTEYKNYNVQ